MAGVGKVSPNAQFLVENAALPAATADLLGALQLAPILFVDDELKVLVGLKRKLRKKFQVEGVDDARKALAQLHGGAAYSVIVSDLRMPSMDGISFLKEVRALAPEAVLVVLTGAVDHDAALSAVNDIGVFRYLQKPCADDVLVGVLEEACANYRKNLYVQDVNRNVRHIDELKSNFLACISHELRTPLNHILGMSEYLMFEEDLNKAEAHVYLGHIRQSGRALRDMIDTLLQLVVVQSGAENSSENPISAQEIMASAASYASSLCEVKNLTSNLRPLDKDVSVLANYAVIEHAVRYIVDNAVKFNQNNGHIDIAGIPDGAYLQLQISDTGIGMTKADLQRAGEIFWQADGGLNRRHGGLGVGLALARRLMESQGGRLTLAQNTSGGVTATLFLPISNAYNDNTYKLI